MISKRTILMATVAAFAVAVTALALPRAEQAVAEDGTEPIDAGGHHTCIVRTGGIVGCWGSNDGGLVMGGAARKRDDRRA